MFDVLTWTTGADKGFLAAYKYGTVCMMPTPRSSSNHSTDYESRRVSRLVLRGASDSLTCVAAACFEICAISGSGRAESLGGVAGVCFKASAIGAVLRSYLWHSCFLPPGLCCWQQFCSAALALLRVVGALQKSFCETVCSSFLWRHRARARLECIIHAFDDSQFS